FVIAFAVFASAVSSLAQNSESIEVRVVNVDVVVRDRAGKPVTGLTKDAFEIYENGQKREITNLYEVTGAPSPIAKGGLSPTPASTETPVEIRRATSSCSSTTTRWSHSAATKSCNRSGSSSTNSCAPRTR
ncbi:MAG: hypothetical protein ACRD3J_31645, partial [Thermoanaerobaculia bacterium]